MTAAIIPLFFSHAILTMEAAKVSDSQIEEVAHLLTSYKTVDEAQRIAHSVSVLADTCTHTVLLPYFAKLYATIEGKYPPTSCFSENDLLIAHVLVMGIADMLFYIRDHAIDELALEAKVLALATFKGTPRLMNDLLDCACAHGVRLGSCARKTLFFKAVALFFFPHYTGQRFYQFYDSMVSIHRQAAIEETLIPILETCIASLVPGELVYYRTYLKMLSEPQTEDSSQSSSANSMKTFSSDTNNDPLRGGTDHLDELADEGMVFPFELGDDRRPPNVVCK